jgi:hypothetical protein
MSLKTRFWTPLSIPKKILTVILGIVITVILFWIAFTFFIYKIWAFLGGILLWLILAGIVIAILYFFVYRKLFKKSSS